MDTKFGTIVCNKMLLNAENSRLTAFTVFELLRENQLEGAPPPSHTHIRVKMIKYFENFENFYFEKKSFKRNAVSSINVGAGVIPDLLLARIVLSII